MTDTDTINRETSGGPATYDDTPLQDEAAIRNAIARFADAATR